MDTKRAGRGSEARPLLLDVRAALLLAEETAAIAQGLREKAEQFRKSSGEIYRRARRGLIGTR